MRSAKLLGRDHVDLGAIDTLAEGVAGLALSRGGAPKVYAYHDPNEDACGFASGPGGLVLAVADGHHGHQGAKRALDTLLDERAPSWTADAPSRLGEAFGETHLETRWEADWEAEALSLCVELNEALLADSRGRNDTPSPTTLCLAIVRRAEDRLFHLCVGDSHLFLCGAEGIRDLGWSGQPHRDRGFLGAAPADADLLRDRCIAGSTRLTGTRALVLATDGLSEKGIGVEDPATSVAGAVAACSDLNDSLRPLHLARNVAEIALAAHRERRSGDNIAVATAWLDA